MLGPQRSERDVAAERDPGLQRDAADIEDEGGLARGEIVRRLVGGDAVFVEPGRLRARLEQRDRVAERRELVGAGKARGSRPDHGNAAPGRRALPVGFSPRCEQRIGSVALQHPILTGAPSAASRTQACSHKVSVGQTRAHMPPMILASRMVFAAFSALPVEIWRMNSGISIPVGQAATQGASQQNRQRSAATRASCGSSGGCRSAKFTS